MARKLTDKQRRFIEVYLANGRNAADAYRKAYNTSASAKSVADEASKLLNNPGIAPVVAEADRRAEAAVNRALDRYEVTKERVVAELARLGFSNMMDYMKVGPDGDPALDFSAISRDQAAALTEVTVEDFKDGRGEDARDVRRVKFKLADKRGPLVDLGKELGMFIERSQSESKVTVTNERDELKRDIAALAQPSAKHLNGKGVVH